MVHTHPDKQVGCEHLSAVLSFPIRRELSVPSPGFSLFLLEQVCVYICVHGICEYR